jgi:cytoskeletal protein RodZ
MNILKKALSSSFSFSLLIAFSPFVVVAGPPSLEAPSNLTATAVSASQINLTWVDNSAKETGNLIEQSTNGSTFTEIASVGENVTSYSITNLSDSTTYYYRVRSYRTKGQSTTFSDYSNTANDTTFPLPMPPTAPTNLSASLGSSTATTTQVLLVWTDNSSDETYFAIERSTNGTNFVTIGSTFSNNNNLTDVAPKGNTYYYRVRACNSNGCSAYTNTEIIVIP